MDGFVDRNSLNIVSLILGTVSLAVALTAYSAPEVNRTYIGANPFAAKRDIISSYMTYLFTCVAVLAVAIQVAMAILELPERIHTIAFYSWLAAACLSTSLAVAYGLACLGRYLARSSWIPKIIEMQRGLYTSVAHVVDNDGLREDQKLGGVALSDYEKSHNFETARGRLEQLENLFEIVPTTDALVDRLNKIRPYFA